MFNNQPMFPMQEQQLSFPFYYPYPMQQQQMQQPFPMIQPGMHGIQLPHPNLMMENIVPIMNPGPNLPQTALLNPYFPKQFLAYPQFLPQTQPIQVGFNGEFSSEQNYAATAALLSNNSLGGNSDLNRSTSSTNTATKTHNPYASVVVDSDADAHSQNADDSFESTPLGSSLDGGSFTGSPLILSSHQFPGSHSVPQHNNQNSRQQFRPNVNATNFAPQRMPKSQMMGAQNQSNQLPPVTFEEVVAQQAFLPEMARTANGSSFIQAALSTGNSVTLDLIWSTLFPHSADLLLDAHGCYVIKSIMERLSPVDLQNFVLLVAADESLLFSMCTHSLHTRRVVQFFLEVINPPTVIMLLIKRTREVSMTQQGCIVMQRAMDIAIEPLRAQLFEVIYANLLDFAVDPFANYVVQHLLEIEGRFPTSDAFWNIIKGHVIDLSCNKFASNVMEKCLFHLTPEVQHLILTEMYDTTEETLYQMLQDSFGNYMIQSSIALASFRDVVAINTKLRPVLQRTPYGHKIEGRLDRRLKGKPVTSRSCHIGSSVSQQQKQHRGGKGSHHIEEEEPW